MRRLTVVLLLIASLLSQGCLCMMVCPESFNDMRLQADDLDLPDDFTLVGEESRGSRSTFMAAPPPEVDRLYAAAWDDGKLCDRIASPTRWASVWPTREKRYGPQSDVCAFDTRIAVGWRAWPVNNWTYKLFVTAVPPDSRSNAGMPSEEECTRIRERHEEQVKSGLAGPFSRSWEAAWCWVPPGQTLVHITVRAGQDWFLPAE